jgi:hypothetical protein
MTLGEGVGRAVLALACVSVATNGAADVPDSIVGTWDLAPIAPVGAPSSSVAVVKPTLSLTITAETYTWDPGCAPATTFSYEVVGGNARLVVVDLVDAGGKHITRNIRLVEEGLAFDLPATECRSPGAAACATPRVLYFNRAASE